IAHGGLARIVLPVCVGGEGRGGVKSQRLSDRTELLRIPRQPLLYALDQIEQQHGGAAEQQHGESVFGPAHLVLFIDAGHAIKQPLDWSNYGVEKSTLTAEHFCHVHAERLGDRQQQSQERDDLYPAIGCHVRISPVSAMHTTGKPSSLRLLAA